MSDPGTRMRRIPQIDELVRRLAGDPRLSEVARPLVLEAVRGAVDEFRARAQRDAAADPDAHFAGPAFADRVAAALSAMLARRHEPVINATGILLHTGLGRAPLSDAAIDAVASAARYAVVEVDPETGERDLRETRIARLLVELTGAEAATVVNNNAAAVMLTLAALARGREVIVARGELVEIGGGFRMPDVMTAAGVVLREVGTTNRTYARDFEAVASPATALLLKVHSSNFRVVGFTASPSVAELAAVAHAHCVPLVHDLGSGLLRPIAVPPLQDEPTVSAALADGADLVTVSGDKLLCGPQAGIIVGKRDLVERLRAHPMFRAVRPGKLDLAALEATLLEYRRSPADVPDLPLFVALARTRPHLRALGEKIRAGLASAPGAAIDVVDTVGYLGSGSAPMREVEGVAVRVRLATSAADRLVARLRHGRPRVFARIESDAVLLETRALFDDEVAPLIDAVRRALTAESER